MDIAKLEAQERQARGSSEARRLRKQGKLPAIIYGHGEAPQNIAVDQHALNQVLEHGKRIVDLAMGGAAQAALIKDVQFDYLGTNPVHVDFMRVSRDERVTVSVPLEFKGTPAGVAEGGVFVHDQVDIEVECLATEIPESIRVNVGALKIGDALHVRDLELPEGVKAISAAETVVCGVKLKREEEEAPAVAAAEAGPAEPEIIGRKEKEAEGEEAE